MPLKFDQNKTDCSNTDRNVQLLCENCNRSKGASISAMIKLLLTTIVGLYFGISGFFFGIHGLVSGTEVATAIPTLGIGVLCLCLVASSLKRYRDKRQVENAGEPNRHAAHADTSKQGVPNTPSHAIRNATDGSQEASTKTNDAIRRADVGGQARQREDDLHDKLHKVEERLRRQYSEQLSVEIEQVKSDAEAALKKSKEEWERERKRQEGQPSISKRTKSDHEHILGLSLPYTKDDVRRCYRERAAKCHPDKVMRMDPAIQTVAEQMTKDLNAARDYLVDKC